MKRVYLPHVNQVAQDIQAQLAEIGVKIKHQQDGVWPLHRDHVAAGEQPFYLLGWGMDYPDCTNFYDFHFASKRPRFGNEFPDIVEEIKAAAQIG